jgi:hypothetical protein
MIIVPLILQGQLQSHQCLQTWLSTRSRLSDVDATRRSRVRVLITASRLIRALGPLAFVV